MNRRTFVTQSAGALAAAHPFVRSAYAEGTSSAPTFKTTNTRWQTAYDNALRVLEGNVQVMPRYDKPVLIEGSTYLGIWMECGPLEAFVYRKFRPDVARSSHMTFFASQMPDGQLRAYNRAKGSGLGQIQMVVPIAATAWELARATGDEELLSAAYDAGCRWDAWLLRYRNTRKSGLIEGFCTYDTGMDNSGRWAGIPNQCPDADAKKCPTISTLPRLCPDLSATVYGARVALTEMAKALGRTAEADRWTESAAVLRDRILSHLYCEEDAAFYDLDSQDAFVRIRCVQTMRVCSEHVPDQTLFDDLWRRQICNPSAFWPAFPLPSVALDDPLFVRPIPRNSWGGASQTLTALRAGRWFDHYGKAAELSSMMDQWCEAIQRDGTFRQQVDPITGEFTQADAPRYSPCALLMVDYTWRLAGIHEEPKEVHWNVRNGHAAADGSIFRMRLDNGRNAEMQYDHHGVNLSLSGRGIGRIETGVARLITTKEGKPKYLLGISEAPQAIVLHLAHRKRLQMTIRPNERLALDGFDSDSLWQAS